MSDAHDNKPVAAGAAQESYIVSEGKKRGSTRDVRPEAVHDKFYTVLRVHAGDALLTDNWHTNEVLDHARKNFEGYTFQMRTLEAWGATIENDRRGYYTAGGRIWGRTRCAIAATTWCRAVSIPP